MKKIDLNMMTKDELDELRDKVQGEISDRINGPMKKVWFSCVNGCYTFFKNIIDARKDVIDDINSINSDDDIDVRFEMKMIPEKEYNLKPNSWYVG